jgi:hypothetical protein
MKSLLMLKLGDPQNIADSIKSGDWVVQKGALRHKSFGP